MHNILNLHCSAASYSFPVAPENDLRRAHCIKGSPNFFPGIPPTYLHNDVILVSLSAPLDKK